MYCVSLFASAVRPQLFKPFLNSLKGTTVKVEVIFAGNCPLRLPMEDPWLFPDGVYYKYITTGNVKPAQCYEIARRACSGETVMWVADDCEFPNDVIGKAYRHWKEKNNPKLILSVQTRESGYRLYEGRLFDMIQHRFFAYRHETPLMAPLGLMGRTFLDELGGLDRDFVCGQYENDIVMRAYAAGGNVEIFGGPDCFVDIDHIGKSLAIGESKMREDFLNRPFAKGYTHDREVLEKDWIKNGQVVLERQSPFQPYEEADILRQSQGAKGLWV